MAVQDFNLIALGYVGLPLAVAFAEKIKVTGFDWDGDRVARICNGQDDSVSVTRKQLEKASVNLAFSSSEEDIVECNCFIVAVPTPVDASKHSTRRRCRNSLKIP